MNSGGKYAGPVSDPAAQIDALRAQGADRFDPVRFCFIEAMARRALVQPESVKRILDEKLARSLADYSARLEQAKKQAGDTLAGKRAQFPDAADDLQQRYESSDFGGLQQRVASLEAAGGSRPLAALLAHISQHAHEMPTMAPAIGARTVIESPGELKAMSFFRSTWSQLSIDQQLAQALAQVPENAGPLNSHRLALQALQQMRDISPEYLKRFMSYVDALFWLDQAETGPGAAQKNSADSEKKRKPGRRSAG